MGQIMVGVGEMLKATKVSDLAEVFELEEGVPEPCGCCAISGRQVVVHYRKVGDPFTEHYWKFYGSLLSLIEVVDDFREGLQ